MAHGRYHQCLDVVGAALLSARLSFQEYVTDAVHFFVF